MVLVLETFPQTFPLFQSIGVCCVHEGNLNSTVGEVCAEGGVDAMDFIQTIAQMTARPDQKGTDG